MRPESAHLRSLALLGLLLPIVLDGCAATGAVPRPFPAAGGLSAAAPLAMPSPTAAIVTAALSLRGTPYRAGGADPEGFDCSGFTQYIFGRSGLALPRQVHEQFQLGREIPPKAIGPGDLLFFSTVAKGASHVGIAVNHGEFVHAPSSTGVVRVEQLAQPYWASRFVGARRLDYAGDGCRRAGDRCL